MKIEPDPDYEVDWAFWIVFACIVAGLYWACLDGCRA